MMCRWGDRRAGGRTVGQNISNCNQWISGSGARCSPRIRIAGSRPPLFSGTAMCVGRTSTASLAPYRPPWRDGKGMSHFWQGIIRGVDLTGVDDGQMEAGRCGRRRHDGEGPASCCRACEWFGAQLRGVGRGVPNGCPTEEFSTAYEACLSSHDTVTRWFLL